MARLPNPGSDEEVWAQLLNEYLLVAHNGDGTPRTGALTSSVKLRDLKVKNPSHQSITNLVLTNDNKKLVWKTAKDVIRATSRPRINVVDYGAKGDGETDDTEAIQAAINAAADGGVVEIPRGIYMVRGLKISASGTMLTGEARWGTRLVRIGGTEPLVDISGRGTTSGHIRYCGISNITMSGNKARGVLLRSYYADSCTYRDIQLVHCAGLSTDLTEVWDTRFLECIWEHCGSAGEPALLLRNSRPAGEFGFSDDNTNQIYFISCRWEGFRDGAVRIDGSMGGSSRLLNGIFFTSCKMETSVAAGPALQIMKSTTIIFVNQLYIAMMAIEPGFSGPLDAVEDHGSHVFMTDVYVQWGVGVRRTNSLVRVHASGPHTYHKLTAFYPQSGPIEAAIVAEPSSREVIVSCSVTNRGKITKGDVATAMLTSPSQGLAIPLDSSGAFRIVSHDTNKDLLKVDNDERWSALHTLGGMDTVGFSDDYETEVWRVRGTNGAARFAAGKFQIEGTKGYVGLHTAPYTRIAMLIRAAEDTDRGLAIIRPSPGSTARLLEFQDENHNLQGQAFDSHGRPLAVGSPPHVEKGGQVSYANPHDRVQDIAGNITAAVRPSPTAPGTIATITFSRPYEAVPLAITIIDHSEVPADLYVSARSKTGFTVSTRKALNGGSILSFDYTVVA